jgi:heat-inducible transcriptional repressor
MQLGEREQAIFRAVVELHIQDAQPVSSGALQRRYDLDLSSASIRTVLHALEEKGLLQQPHTSAGRVPTRDGYRLYVDLFLQPEQLPEAWERRIAAELQVTRDVHEVLERVSRLLAGLSNNIGVGVSLPSEPLPHIRRLELVPVDGTRIMAVVTLENGVVRSEVLALDREVPPHHLDAAARIIQSIVADRTPGAARTHLDRALRDRHEEGSDLARDLARQKEKIFWDWPLPVLHLQGASEIMGQPEFTDPRTLRMLVQLLDHPENLESVFREQLRAGEPSVTIGDESNRSELSPFSLVISSCTIAGRPGLIGILGPMRMRYALALGLVDGVAKAIRGVEPQS